MSAGKYGMSACHITAFLMPKSIQHKHKICNKFYKSIKPVKHQTMVLFFLQNIGISDEGS